MSASRLRRICYLNHSGFYVEADDFVLVFDFYSDPARRLKELENCGKPVSFFVSHAHADHWNPEIFAFNNTVPSRYFCDRSLKRAAEKLAAAHPRSLLYLLDEAQVLDGAALDGSGLRAILTAPSTDEGLAFWLETTAGGASVYHAGDLNDWDWSDAEGPAVERRYREILLALKTRVVERWPCPIEMELAFVPLDQRLGSKALAGARIFLEYFRPSYLLPMHLNGGLRLPAELAAYCAAAPELAAVRVPELTQIGEIFALT